MLATLHQKCRTAKENNMLAAYILASLAKQPQSGYDLLKDIKEKTEGQWVPSKSAIYPLMKMLEKQHYISIYKREQRAKKIYQLTNKGKKALDHLRKHPSIARSRILSMRKLLGDVFGEHFASNTECLLNIREHIFKIHASKKNQVTRILKTCLADLKKLQ